MITSFTGEGDQLVGSAGIAIDNNGRVLITNPEAGVIHVFERVIGSSETQSISALTLNSTGVDAKSLWAQNKSSSHGVRIINRMVDRGANRTARLAG